MLDKKYRLFGKIAVADILLFVLFVLFVLLALRFSAPQSVSAKPGDTKIRYTVELNKKPPGFEDKIQIGTPLFDTEKGYQIGQIIDVRTETYVEDANDFIRDVITRAPVEGLNYVYVVAEANAQITDGTTLIGQYDMMVGKEVFVRSKDFASSGFVIKIERLGEQEGSDGND